jgi:hypothetical protein
MLAGGWGWSSWRRLASAARGEYGCRHGQTDKSWQALAGAGGHGRGGDGDGDRRGGQHHLVPSLVTISYLRYQSFDVVILTIMSMILTLSGCEIALRDNESERGWARSLVDLAEVES